jgi:hypothetical protein
MQVAFRILLFMVFVWVARAEVVPLRKLSQSERTQRIAGDSQAVKIYRDGLEKVTAFAQRQTNLFPDPKPPESRLPRREEKEVLWQIWKSYLDYLLALDAIDHYHHDWSRLSGQQREQSFAAGYGAFLAKYRFSLQLIADVERNPLLDTILNEPVPELGLPARSYAKVKYRFLNGFTATEFGARAIVRETMHEGATGNLLQGINNDAEALLKMGRGQGELLTLKNALKILERAGDTAWFPVQAGVAEWMGDTKVYRSDRSLISQAQIQQLKLMPGDVLLVRREWYLSNIGLPGFWPHAALYIGTPEERRRFFAEPEMSAWIKSQNPDTDDFETLLETREHTAYAQSLKPQEKNHQTRILEAMSEGVSFTALEHCADADSVVVLRPSLSKKEKATALLRAFHYAGRPYDFNFDFATDSELVCTELVFKCYEPSQGFRGLRLPLTEMLGRKLLPANEIARQFDSQYGSADAQFQFVTFLDGFERGRKAVEATVEQFRQSWRRPKWHVLTQDAGK